MTEELVLVDIVTQTEGETGNKPWRRFVINKQFSTFDPAIGQQALDARGFHAFIDWRWKGQFREITGFRRAE